MPAVRQRPLRPGAPGGLELVLHQDSDAPTAALSAALLPARWGWTRPGPASSSSPFWPPGPT
ncbi:MAG: hypothetical protein ACLRWQ_14865 [Flavonifractor plautii]